ncbi:hypothetical protein V6U71_18850 [Sphingopyxis sp. J-6]|uniref:hypothetical protein n=1 Tax=Sphingopyxis sp. J-6 TaxID=3122054 RepID=UPI003984014F
MSAFDRLRTRPNIVRSLQEFLTRTGVVMVRLIRGTGLIVAIMISGWGYATAEERSAGLFVNEEAALKYTSSFGQGWDAPVSTESDGDLFKLKIKVFDFQLNERRGYALLGSDKAGVIRYYEVRFPIIEKRCSGAPETRTLARSLLNRFEPAQSGDMPQINRLASLAELVWPYEAFSSGPGIEIGDTGFKFYKMNGYCSFRVFRSPNQSAN